MRNTSALVTYIYPEAKKYLTQLFESINNQTFKEFDFVVFSDAVLDSEVDWKRIDHSLIPLEGTPIEIRIQSISILKHLNYEKFVFVDADDTLSYNRLEKSVKLLDNYCIVCNDLNRVNDEGKLIGSEIWKERLSTNFEFKSDFLLDKNILGFGNTSVRREVLKFEIKHPKNFIVAADWYIFYTFLKLSGEVALFTAVCSTNYRQHSNNVIGSKEFSKDRLIITLRTKERHYAALMDADFKEVKGEFEKVNDLLSKSLNSFSLKELPKDLFWWEEDNYLKA